jgi:hypothetical protein
LISQKQIPYILVYFRARERARAGARFFKSKGSKI